MPRQPRKHELALRKRIKEPAEIIVNLTRDALDDVLGHAGQVAGQMDGDGQDYVRLSRSGPLEVANRRLDRLGSAIVSSIKDSRVQFYVHSFELQIPDLNPDHHDMEVHPTHEGAVAVADAAINGRSLQQEVVATIEAVKFMLRNALLQCGITGRSEQILNGWKASASGQLTGKAEKLLSDSSHAIHDAVKYATIKEELRPKI